MLSDSAGLYLITVFRITQNEPWAKTGQIASALDVGMSSVSEMLKQLDEAGYIVHRSRMGAQLTEKGYRLALNRLRKHRILETFLVEVVGYSIDEVHDEAGRLEHVISDRLIDRLEKLLGCPRFDPHGHPIPDSNGTMDRIPSHSLCQMTVGAIATICEIDDANPEKISYLRSLALVPGTKVKVTETAPMQGPITVAVNGTTTPLAFELAREIKVIAPDAHNGTGKGQDASC